MAWAGASIAGAELAAFDADKPLLLSYHAFREDAAPGLIWNQTGTSAPDDTDSDYPTHRAYDGFIHNVQTRPDSDQTTWYLVAQPTNTHTIDCLVVHGENLGSASQVDYQIADDSAFTTRLATLATWTPSNDNRLSSFALDDLGGGGMKRYTGVRYQRLKIQHSTGYAPAIREWWVSRRRQMLYFPNIPWDDAHERTRISSFVALSGVKTEYALFAGQSLRNATWDISTLAEITAFKNWWRKCNYGTWPFYFVETPNSGATPRLMTFVDDRRDFDRKLIGPILRRLTISMEEQPPFYDVEFSIA